MLSARIELLRNYSGVPMIHTPVYAMCRGVHTMLKMCISHDQDLVVSLLTCDRVEIERGCRQIVVVRNSKKIVKLTRLPANITSNRVCSQHEIAHAIHVLSYQYENLSLFLSSLFKRNSSLQQDPIITA